MAAADSDAKASTAKVPDADASTEAPDDAKVPVVKDRVINGDFEMFLITIKDRRADTVADIKGFCPSMEIDDKTEPGKVTVTFLSGFKQFNFRQTFETMAAWEEWVARARKEGNFNFF